VPSFGPADWVTTVRAGLVAALAWHVMAPRLPAATVCVTLALAAAALDGVDGWVARRTRTASAFGARFDMETDALLIMVLSLLVWRYDKAGSWVVASGLLRYGFVAAGAFRPWLRQPLEPSRRRQTMCVVQIVALIFVLLPAVTRPLSTLVAAASLAALCWSFFVDILRLWRRIPAYAPDLKVGPTGADVGPSFSSGAKLAAALLLLNASLTFRSVWPTPGVRWTGEVSIELALGLVILIVVTSRIGAFSRQRLRFLPRWLGVLWLLLVIGRYLDVTAQALYGRDINLYWDLRFMPDVASMLARAAPWWLLLLVCAGVVLAVILLYALVRWALGRVGDATARAGERRMIGVLATAAVLLFAVEQWRAPAPHERIFPPPVTATYARQARLIVDALTGGTSIAASPAMTSDFSRVKGADVLLVFMESYGAVSYDRPEFAGGLAPSRRELESAISDTRRHVVSAFVESPTFGGVSWLAHITLMSGVEVRDPHTNAVLMTQKRDTLVRAFSRSGYRTLAVMPGLWQNWPEGAFYGFDDIYGAPRLDYRGPQFGWFSLTDQFALAQLDALEIARTSRPPLFVFFPTISTHTPFTPTPPYQPDWPRMLTGRPYDFADLERAYNEVADWLNLGPGYVNALSYSFRSLAGYLRLRGDHDFAMILIGDHQPPAAVAGEGAPWDVPVHVIAGRTAVLDRLRAHGFRDGLTPPRPAIGRMHALLPVLLDAFGNPE
jgi:phosphatidylglycerophosphate synthase